jgi:hypothetical protein
VPGRAPSKPEPPGRAVATPTQSCSVSFHGWVIVGTDVEALSLLLLRWFRPLLLLDLFGTGAGALEGVGVEGPMETANDGVL